MRKVLILIDAENFTRSVSKIAKERQENRYIDWYKVNSFVLEYLSKNLQYQNENLIHIRTYFYNGEITDKLLRKIQKWGKEEDIEKAENIRKKSEKLDNYAKSYYYFEMKKKPLQYTKDKGLYQKGVDVELAVDLVKFAFRDTYDIVALFSGDVDLLESVKTVKDLGKHVIAFSCSGIMAQELRANVDMFVDFRNLNSEILDLFTHIFKKKEDIGSIDM